MRASRAYLFEMFTVIGVLTIVLPLVAFTVIVVVVGEPLPLPEQPAITVTAKAQTTTA
jgi:hypothetical protein